MSNRLLLSKGNWVREGLLEDYRELTVSVRKTGALDLEIGSRLGGSKRQERGIVGMSHSGRGLVSIFPSHMNGVRLSFSFYYSNSLPWVICLFSLRCITPDTYPGDSRTLSQSP